MVRRDPEKRERFLVVRIDRLGHAIERRARVAGHVDEEGAREQPLEGLVAGVGAEDVVTMLRSAEARTRRMENLAEARMDAAKDRDEIALEALLGPRARAKLLRGERAGRAALRARSRRGPSRKPAWTPRRTATRSRSKRFSARALARNCASARAEKRFERVASFVKPAWTPRRTPATRSRARSASRPARSRGEAPSRERAGREALRARSRRGPSRRPCGLPRRTATRSRSKRFSARALARRSFAARRCFTRDGHPRTRVAGECARRSSFARARGPRSASSAISSRSFAEARMDAAKDRDEIALEALLGPRARAKELRRAPLLHPRARVRDSRSRRLRAPGAAPVCASDRPCPSSPSAALPPGGPAPRPQGGAHPGDAAGDAPAFDAARRFASSRQLDALAGAEGAVLLAPALARRGRLAAPLALAHHGVPSIAARARQASWCIVAAIAAVRPSIFMPAS